MVFLRAVDFNTETVSLKYIDFVSGPNRLSKTIDPFIVKEFRPLLLEISKDVLALKQLKNDVKIEKDLEYEDPKHTFF